MTDKRDYIIRAITNELHIVSEDVKNIIMVRSDGFFEVRFITDWIMYDCFVDDSTFEVVGIDSRPLPISSLLNDSFELAM